jgi:hypothetical protein
MAAVWFIALLCIAGAAAQDTTAQGTHITTNSGQNLNLTLSIVQGTAAGSGPSYCVVGNADLVNNTYTYYAADGATPEVNKTDTYAKIYANVYAGDSASFTFYGGNVTTQGAPASSTLVYTVTNSTDTGSATGPLYITKSPLQTPTPAYRLDFAQFFSQTAGQTAWFAGGLGEIGAAPACIYNITFTAFSRP